MKISLVKPIGSRVGWSFFLLLAFLPFAPWAAFAQRAATAEAVVVNGFLVAINVTDSGEGYIEPPLVSVVGTGSGAVASATLDDGRVASVQVENAGSNYSTRPRIVIAPPPDKNRFLTEKLVAYFPLDSSFQNLLQPTVPQFKQGVTGQRGSGHPMGRWTDFSGSNSFVISERSAFINTISNWTWSAWIKLPNNPTNNDSDQLFYSEGFQSSTFRIGYHPSSGNFTVASWNRETLPELWRGASFAIRPGTNWFQLTYTMENATTQGGTLKMFTNGVLLRTARLQIPLPPIDQQIPSQFQVGLGEEIVYYYERVRPATFQGGMSDVRIFQRTLSSSEVARLYAGDREDTDSDGINDNLEVQRFGTSPSAVDSDSDGLSDGEEISAGVNPLDSRSRPETIQAFSAVELEFWTNLDALYQLQSSPDLATWTDSGPVFPGVGDKLTRLASTRPSQHLYWRLVHR